MNQCGQWREWRGVLLESRLTLEPDNGERAECEGSGFIWWWWWTPKRQVTNLDWWFHFPQYVNSNAYGQRGVHSFFNLSTHKLLAHFLSFSFTFCHTHITSYTSSFSFSSFLYSTDTTVAINLTWFQVNSNGISWTTKPNLARLNSQQLFIILLQSDGILSNQLTSTIIH